MLKFFSLIGSKFFLIAAFFDPADTKYWANMKNSEHDRNWCPLADYERQIGLNFFSKLVWKGHQNAQHIRQITAECSSEVNFWQNI